MAVILSNRRHAHRAEVQDGADDDVGNFLKSLRGVTGSFSHASFRQVDTSVASLLGKLPKPENILMDGLLGKLTSQYTWKPLRAALTATSLNFCRPNDDILIDSIPLHEIIDIKKRSDFPGVSNGAPDLCLRNVAAFFEEQSSDQLHIIQIQTVEGGRNSGRTYYLNADTAPKCKEWMHATQAAADLADLRHLAGPRCFRRARRALRRLYQHPTTQTLTGVLIVLNFAAPIAQAELPLHRIPAGGLASKGCQRTVFRIMLRRSKRSVLKKRRCPLRTSGELSTART